MNPSRRDLSYSLKAVFLIWPCLVANTRKLSVGEVAGADDGLDALVGGEAAGG